MRIAAAIGCIAAALRLAPAAAAEPLIMDDGFATALLDAQSMRLIGAFPRQPILEVPPPPGATASTSNANTKAAPFARPPVATIDNLVGSHQYAFLSQDGARLLVSPPHAAVDVWSVERQALELRLPESDAVGILGKSGERVAAIRQRGPRAIEFAVWDVAARRPVFARTELVFAGMSFHRIGSPRFAVYSIGRELRIWDDLHRTLKAAALPVDFMVGQVVPSRDGQRIAVIGAYERNGAPREGSGNQLFVFDLASARLTRHFSLTGNAPRVLGWTANGAWLIVQDHAALSQVDALTGAVAHQWQYVPRLGSKAQTSPLDVLSARPTRRSKLVGGVPMVFEALLDPEGRRLVLSDPAWDTLVSWDVTVSPPKRLPDLCENDRCGDDTRGIAFDSDGRILVHDVQHASELLVIDSAAQRMHTVSLDARAWDAASRKAAVPALSLETCSWDPARCLDHVRKTYDLDKSCQTGATARCEEKRVWLKRACGMVPEEFCAPLWNVGRALHDEATLRAGLSARCEALELGESAHRPDAREWHERTRTFCAPLEQVLPARDEEALRADCDADIDYCWLAARVARLAKSSKLAIALAQRGCEAASRRACIEGGMAALDARQAARADAFFADACVRIDEPQCVAGLQRASALAQGSARKARSAAAPKDALQLCAELRYLRYAGVRHFTDGAFDGVRVHAIMRGDPQALPFAPGDVLLNTVGCADEGCAPESFTARLQSACEVPADRLLHDLELEVVSPVPGHNRKLVLRRAAH